MKSPTSRCIRIRLLATVTILFVLQQIAVAISHADVTRDVRYGEHDAQALDIYAPPDAAGSPVMVYVHGGGWQRGDKSRVGQKPDYFNQHGWVFVSINYRLLPEGRHPKNVEDVAAAVAWVHDHISEYGGDPALIFIMGHSAGAHLVSLVATDERPLQKAHKPLAIIKGVISLDTQGYDIVRLLDGWSSDLYRAVFGADLNLQRDASPAHHVAASKGIPPFLICYSGGMGQNIMPNRREQATLFATRLSEAGVPAEVVDASDRNHGQINQWFGDPKDTKVTGKAEAFHNEILAKSKHPSLQSTPPLPEQSN